MMPSPHLLSFNEIKVGPGNTLFSLCSFHLSTCNTVTKEYLGIQTEIMKRTPTISLIRFRSVSKQWKSLIDSCKFIKDHSQYQHRILAGYMLESDSDVELVEVNESLGVLEYDGDGGCFVWIMEFVTKSCTKMFTCNLLNNAVLEFNKNGDNNYKGPKGVLTIVGESERSGDELNDDVTLSYKVRDAENAVLGEVKLLIALCKLIQALITVMMASTSKSNLRNRDWSELPSDIMSNILSRLCINDILENAQKVCTAWRKVSKDPAMWRVINMNDLFDPNESDEYYYVEDEDEDEKAEEEEDEKAEEVESKREISREKVCKHLVDRSQGQLVDLTLKKKGVKVMMASTSKSNLRNRDWSELPSDIMSNILSRLCINDILENAQKVCTAWRKVSKDPAMWRVINMNDLFDPNESDEYYYVEDEDEDEEEEDEKAEIWIKREISRKRSCQLRRLGSGEWSSQWGDALFQIFHFWRNSTCYSEIDSEPKLLLLVFKFYLKYYEMPIAIGNILARVLSASYFMDEQTGRMQHCRLISGWLS
ncbi:putative leucine-rich repeat domain-like protein [Tanacetum coccineum]